MNDSISGTRAASTRPPGEPSYRYRGKDRTGCGRTGSTVDPAALAERSFNQGWRWLEIKAPDGREVGGIGRNIDHPRRRTWWAEDVTGLREAAAARPDPEARP